MGQRVVLDEGGYVDVHTRIKDMCREARNRMGLTNQNIADRISERFTIDSFSVNTVNNFFSDRSKATTIYTTGYICAVLDISIDAAFGIEHRFNSREESEFVKQLSELKVELRDKDQYIHYMESMIREKDKRIEQAHTAINHYRSDSKRQSKKFHPWVFWISLALLACTIVFMVVYLIVFDIGNPGYGIF